MHRLAVVYGPALVASSLLLGRPPLAHGRASLGSGSLGGSFSLRPLQCEFEGASARLGLAQHILGCVVQSERVVDEHVVIGGKFAGPRHVSGTNRCRAPALFFGRSGRGPPLLRERGGGWGRWGGRHGEFGARG